MALTMYGYPKCGTCRNAHKWLKENAEDPHYIDIVQNPPTSQELQALIARSGLSVSSFFNVSGEVYRELGLKDKLSGLSDKEKLALLAGNGKLIKRPIVTDGSRATVGFKDETFAGMWGKQR